MSEAEIVVLILAALLAGVVAIWMPDHCSPKCSCRPKSHRSH